MNLLQTIVPIYTHDVGEVSEGTAKVIIGMLMVIMIIGFLRIAYSLIKNRKKKFYKLEDAIMDKNMLWALFTMFSVILGGITVLGFLGYLVSELIF